MIVKLQPKLQPKYNTMLQASLYGNRLHGPLYNRVQDSNFVSVNMYRFQGL